MRAIALALLLITTAAAQTSDPHAIPAVDAALGPCTADFTINDDAGKPVYGSKITVRVAYGFMNSHRLDLELGTNIDGKGRFTGLPDRLKHGLFFEATEGDRTGNAFNDTSKTCKAQFTIVLRKAPK